MIIESELKDILHPKIYQRNGSDCYYDTYREKLVPITPEETIRQQVLAWCESKLNVPKEFITVEQHLSHYGLKTTGRADIVIHIPAEDGMLPLAVIECKASTVFLTNMTFEQCFRYADMLEAEYALATNGSELIAFKYDEVSRTYLRLSEVPDYVQMTKGEYAESQPLPLINRPSLSEMLSPDIQKRYVDDCIIGSATTPTVRSHIINFLEALLDTNCSLSRLESKSFSVIEDIGMRILSYGNASGYDYVAPYRSFLIRDKTKNHQIVSIGFNAYGNDKTILCIAIDDYQKSHHALQLLFDTYVVQSRDKLQFFHTGRIAVGHSGSGSSEEVLAKVAVELPELFCENKIYLGELPMNKLLTIDLPQMTKLIFNLIEYALLRDEYRNEAKDKRNK